MYIDTHAHLYLPSFDSDLPQVIGRALAQGIDKILMPNIDLSSIAAMHNVENQYTGTCIAMMGLHPCSVNGGFEADLLKIEDHLNRRTYIAVGEIGIDLYWDKTFFDQQVQSFKTQVCWAYEHAIPIVIHSRESIDIILGLLEKMALPGLKGVFHCFTGDLAQAERIIDLGFFMGIGGVVTFKNGGIDRILSKIPLRHLLLETDAPYLAPQPHRGARNESSYIPIIAEKISSIYQIPVETISHQTCANARTLFGDLDHLNHEMLHLSQ